MKKVTCSKCKGFSIIDIQNGQLAWSEVGKVISARYRSDSQFGFQCVCGNNSIMTEQEIKLIKDPVQPTPRELSEIKNNLIIKPDNRFVMTEARA